MWFVLGAPWARVGQAERCGEVALLSRGGAAAGWRPAGEGIEWQFGESIAAIRDVDGDGVEELLVGAPGARSGDGDRVAGAVTAYASSTGRALWRAWGPVEPAEFPTVPREYGSSIAVVDDVDGDGYPDVVVGAPGGTGTGHDMRSEGSVVVLSGRTGAELRRIESESGDHAFGFSMVALPTVAGSGPMLVVGAPHGQAWYPEGRSHDGGSVTAIDPRTGLRKWRWTPRRDPRVEGVLVTSSTGAGVAACRDGGAHGHGRVFASFTYSHTPEDRDAGWCYGIFVLDADDGALLEIRTAERGAMNWGPALYCASSRSSASLLVSGCEAGPGGEIAHDEVIRAWDDDHGRSILVKGLGGLGSSMTGVGDLDGDGTDDVIAGAPWTVDGDGEMVGGAAVLSVRTGAVLLRIRGSR